jgi:hypothetical protein
MHTPLAAADSIVEPHYFLIVVDLGYCFIIL